MWTTVAEIMTIMIPAAAHCVHQGWILVIPGSVRPMAATTSATPRNMRNDVDIDSFICATMSAGGKSSRIPCARNARASNTCRSQSTLFMA